MNDEVLEFIKRRFKKDCNWTDGNCYYFAIILKARFPIGEIYYDVVNGHFVFWLEGEFYDWNGVVKSNGYHISWDLFDKYDSLQRERIVRDCVL